MTVQLCKKRSAGRVVAAHCALSSFMEPPISIIYLVNKRYRPFYKWMHRGMRTCPCWAKPATGAGHHASRPEATPGPQRAAGDTARGPGHDATAGSGRPPRARPHH